MLFLYCFYIVTQIWTSQCCKYLDGVSGVSLLKSSAQSILYLYQVKVKPAQLLFVCDLEGYFESLAQQGFQNNLPSVLARRNEG